MDGIQQFQEIRRDGKIIEETMTEVEMVRAGWLPDKVLSLHWVWCGTPLTLQSQFGLLSRIVDNRKYLVVLEDLDAEGQATKLSVYHADGKLHRIFPNVIPVAGKPELGRFASFRRPHSGVPTAFLVLFDLVWKDYRFEVEIDAANNKFIAVQQLRYPF